MNFIRGGVMGVALTGVGWFLFSVINGQYGRAVGMLILALVCFYVHYALTLQQKKKMITQGLINDGVLKKNE